MNPRSLVVSFISFLQRQTTWMLWLFMVVVSLAMSELIVAVMEWLLLGKVTADYLLTGMVASVVIASLVVAVILYSGEQARFLAADLSATLQAIPDLLFELGRDGEYFNIWAKNPQSLAAQKEMLLGHTVSEMLPPEAGKTVMSALQEADEKGYSHGHVICLSFPQGESWFELSTSVKATSDTSSKRFIMLARDISEHKRAEATVQRLNNLYAALSQCSQAILRCDNEAELFPIICRNAVEFGGMQMTWVGLLDDSSKLVTPVASFGTGTDYLEGIQISVDQNEPTGRGPTGTSIREDRPYWCQDFQHDPATAAWRERGAPFAWAASAALPLHRKGTVIGAITFYIDEVNVFDNAAQNLLLEMAMDISFALDRFADASEHLRMEDILGKLSLAVEQSPNTIVITDLAANIEYVNSTFTKTTGYSPEEVAGKNPRILQSGKTPKATYDDMWAHLSRGEIWRGELINRRKVGSEIIESVLISPVRQADGRVTNYLMISEDITARIKSDERIDKLAHYDQLTGLPNRTLLNERFKFALSLAQRNGEQMAVIFLDLDHFKDVNDTLGHSIGDKLLMEVAKRLKATLREEDTVSRQGGDEFILVLPDTTEIGAAHVAEKLLEVVSVICRIEQHELVVTPSIGIAIYPHDGEDFETLSKNADTAMYRAKQDGRNNFRFFTPAMQAHSARTLQLVNALRRALSRNELSLHYQPQVTMKDGHVIGAEALLRWQHPELGMISPAEFIPIAEDSGQIIQIGEWVLRTALRQLKDWLDSGMPPMVMAVNLSAAQFRQPNLTELITSILDEVKIPHEYLELELTEAVAMDDPQAAVEVMDKLNELGIRMSIDDFGTGYSSLSYLKRFKVYKLKIDQSFVRDINEDPEDKAIVTAIINLATSLGMHTIAEGVETSGQLAFLRMQGCDEAQGYYFSKALPAEQFAQFMRDYEKSL